VLASLAVAALGAYLLVLWGMPWEGIRVGNGHIGGYRLATFTRHGPGPVIVMALIVFWLIAMVRRRVSATWVAGASMVSCALLAAMFVRTFVTGPLSYVIVSAALLAVVAALRLAGRAGSGRAKNFTSPFRQFV